MKRAADEIVKHPSQLAALVSMAVTGLLVWAEYKYDEKVRIKR